VPKKEGQQHLYSPPLGHPPRSRPPSGTHQGSSPPSGHSYSPSGTRAQGCHTDDIGRTDGRTIAAGASVTWTQCSILFEVTWGKTLASARTGSIQAMDAKELHKGSSNIPFSLPSSPLPKEAIVYLVHFVVWATIRGVLFLVILVVVLQIKFFSTEPFEDYFKVVAT
jgi:hypothetical protein